MIAMNPAPQTVHSTHNSVASLPQPTLWVPPGNTGGANLNPFKPKPVPPDLRPFLD